MPALILHPSVLREAVAPERLAIAARTHYLLSNPQSPWVNIDEALESVGLSVNPFKGNSPLSGALAVEDFNGAVRGGIFINPNLKGFAAAFLKAHVLGHFLLHIAPKVQAGDFVKGGFKEIVDPLKSYENRTSENNFELEANQFAAAFFLPKGMLQQAWKVKKNASAVADFFRLPASFIEARSIDTGIIEPSRVNTAKDSQKQIIPAKGGMNRLREIARTLAK